VVKVSRRTETSDAPVWQGAEERQYRDIEATSNDVQTGCSVRRMQADFHHGLLGVWAAEIHRL
jgi:hypothetical protein